MATRTRTPWRSSSSPARKVARSPAWSLSYSSIAAGANRAQQRGLVGGECGAQRRHDVLDPGEHQPEHVEVALDQNDRLLLPDGVLGLVQVVELPPLWKIGVSGELRYLGSPGPRIRPPKPDHPAAQIVDRKEQPRRGTAGSTLPSSRTAASPASSSTGSSMPSCAIAVEKRRARRARTRGRARRPSRAAMLAAGEILARATAASATRSSWRANQSCATAAAPNSGSQRVGPARAAVPGSRFRPGGRPRAPRSGSPCPAASSARRRRRPLSWQT